MAIKNCLLNAYYIPLMAKKAYKKSAIMHCDAFYKKSIRLKLTALFNNNRIDTVILQALLSSGNRLTAIHWS